MAPALSCCAVGSLVVVLLAGDQVHDEAGNRATQRDSSHQAQQCQPETAVGTAANDESSTAGYCERSQRLLSYVFADVAIALTPIPVRFGCGRPC